MKQIDLTLPSPAENLALDEALLDECEAGGSDEILRFWEPREYFVVVGYANEVATEVNVLACQARGIPIFRRCSGGGTVLQGPGCLNYALILRITEDGPFRGIGVANQFIMRQNRAAIESALRTPHSAIAVRGHTDLAVGDRKFSGNSQRRRKHFLLFHGTFLLNLDLQLVRELLPMPSKQPDYREDRSHENFLANLNMSATRVKEALKQSWNAMEASHPFPEHMVQKLVAQKYSTDEWNRKF
jgi:lipoate-protein ligase A